MFFISRKILVMKFCISFCELKFSVMLKMLVLVSSGLMFMLSLLRFVSMMMSVIIMNSSECSIGSSVCSCVVCIRLFLCV